MLNYFATHIFKDYLLLLYSIFMKKLNRKSVYCIHIYVESKKAWWHWQPYAYPSEVTYSLVSSRLSSLKEYLGHCGIPRSLVYKRTTTLSRKAWVYLLGSTTNVTLRIFTFWSRPEVEIWRGWRARYSHSTCCLPPFTIPLWRLCLVDYCRFKL